MLPLTVVRSCSLATIALAASGVSAQFSRPKPSDRFSGINPRPNNIPPTRVSGPNNGRVTTVTARVECSAEAQASTFVGFADVFASACVSPLSLPSRQCPSPGPHGEMHGNHACRMHEPGNVLPVTSTWKHIIACASAHPVCANEYHRALKKAIITGTDRSVVEVALHYCCTQSSPPDSSVVMCSGVRRR